MKRHAGQGGRRKSRQDRPTPANGMAAFGRRHSSSESPKWIACSSSRIGALENSVFANKNLLTTRAPSSVAMSIPRKSNARPVEPSVLPTR